MFPKLRYLLRQAISVMARSVGVTAVSVVTIGVALTVLATFAVVVRTLDTLSSKMGEELEVSAYLLPDIDVDGGLALSERIEAWPEVRRARYLSSADAIKELEESLGADASLLAGLPPDILPSSVEIQMQPDAWTKLALDNLATKLAELPGIEDIRYGQDEIEQVNAFLDLTRVAALIMGIALSFGTILIVSNTIRLTVYARRDEIDIMSLVGATRGFVQAPFVIEGAIQGGFGGLSAFAALLGMREGLRLGIERGLGGTYAVDLSLSPALFFVGLFVAGVSLGLFGSLIAVSRFLKV